MYINAHILSSVTPDYGYVYALDASADAPQPTPIPTPSPTPPPVSGTLHSSDLDGSSAASGTRHWKATVTISVHDTNDSPVSGLSVSSKWSNGYSGTASCTTGSTGSCSITTGNVKNGTATVTFTLNNLSKPGYTYNAAANHDPDGDSNGTQITVNKP